MKKILFFLALAFTSMAVNAQTAWSEDFSNVTDLETSGWTLYSDGLTNSDNYSSFGDSWLVTEVSAGNNAAVSISWTVPEGTDCDRWMITPAINVPSADYSFYCKVWGRDASYPEKVKIMISTTGTNKTDFTELVDIVMDGSNYTPGWNDILLNLANYANQNVYIAFVNHGDGYYTIVDDLSLAVYENNSIACNSVDAPGFVAQGANFNANVTVTNTGAAPLTSFDIEYTINGGTATTINVTGINVASFATYTHTISATSSTLGTNTISVTVSNPNGETDVDAADNSATTTTTVYDPSTATQRTSVMEHFTTAVCPNCPSGHNRLEAAIQGQEDRVVWIAHHVGYYTDNMTIDESNEMLSFFNDGGSTFAPAWMIDRNYDNVDDKSEYPGPAFFPGANARQVLTNALSAPAFVNVSVSDVNYNTDSRTLTVSVSGNFTSDMTFASPRLSVYIMEDGIQGSQSGANGTYTHNHVLRGCITDVWGDASAITSTNAGSTFSKTYTFQVPATWKANKCWVAAFVNDYGSDVMHRTIANGAKSGYITNVAINDVENTTITVKTYPNPVSEIAVVESSSNIRSYQLVDATGRVVMRADNLNVTALELDVRTLAQGVYFINLSTDNGTYTQKVVKR